MIFNKRHWILGTALIATLIVALFLRKQDEVVDNTVVAANNLDGGLFKKKASDSGNNRNEAQIKLGLLQQRLLEPDVARDIFMVPRKAEPVVSKAAVVPAKSPKPVVLPVLPTVIPKPTSPVLPFTYLGKLNDAGQVTVFLSAGSKSFVVKTGDVVAQVYRIDEIKPPTMTMTYLPLNIKQTMPIGEAN